MKARVVAGIDEAGLGPMLGPLAMGVCAVRFPADVNADSASALWDMLSEALTETPSRGEERLVVADSKKVFQRSPLGWKRLEATATSFLQTARQAQLATLADGFVADQMPLKAPWYRGVEAPLETRGESADLQDHVQRLLRALRANDLAVCHTGLRLSSAIELNESYARTDSKGITTWQITVGLLAELMQRFGQEGAHVIVDRQGGRKHYGALLERDFPGCGVQTLREGKLRSDYWVFGPEGDLWISFRVQAEEQSLPTAVASCLAKFGREVSMQHFNEYFSTHEPSLRPTAGYVTDARRWLADAGPLIARLGVERDDLIRAR